ncbi:MAG: hypothetical protein U0075_00760 [Thermomicrobiales bacterium]
MSQRGRGPGPEDDPGTEERDRLSDYSFSRPIQPYDPYRKSEEPRRPSRNVAAESDALRNSSRNRKSPFLDDDDPLNAAAWDLDEEVEVDAFEARYDESYEADFEEPRPAPLPRTRRRQASTAAATGRRRSTRRAAGEPAAARGPRLPNMQVSIGAPRAVTDASLVADPAAMLLLGLNLLSVLIMALLLGIRLGSLPPEILLRLDAAGNPNLWGPPSVLWRLPLMSLFLTVMFLAVSWFLHPIDRFAARFALGAAIAAQLVAWVAVIQHLAG